MNLDKVLPHYVRKTYTERLFFGKYCYKVVLEVDKTQLILDHTRNRDRLVWRRTTYTNSLKLLTLLKKELLLIAGENCRTRQEWLKISFFTNDKNHVDAIIDKFARQILEISFPANQAHVDFLSKNRKVLVRERLFNDRYKYKVYINPYNMRTERFRPVAEFLEHFDKTRYDVNNILRDFWSPYTHSINSLGWTVAVYFKDLEDLMMFQLRFTDDIMKIEEIVLVRDLK